MARCIYPVHLRTGDVPCGKCITCIDNYRSGWALRLYQESKNNAEAYFVTLTYNMESVPIVITNNKLFYSLSKTHIQLFIKKMRKKLQLRYYICGEYGPQGDRPHYHGIFYFKQKQELTDLNLLIKHTWDYGFISISPVKITDYSYVCKYLRKSQTVLDYKFHRQLNNQLPDFSLMSKRPPIGENISLQDLQAYMDDKAPCLSGKTYTLPRRYKDMLRSCDYEAYEKWQKETIAYFPPEYISEEHHRNKVLTNYNFYNKFK